MVRRRAWRRALPKFDRPEWCQKERRATANALRFLGWDHESVRNCRNAQPCRSGLCPKCIRQLRVQLLNFLEDEQLHHRDWYLVTIRVEGWKVAPGDCTQFEALRDHRLIENLLTRFRRMRLPGLLIFGSIETVHITVANVPVEKPFHLHLMISGATAEQIQAAIRATIPLDPTDVRPLLIDPVQPTRKDFFRAASYAFKHPLQKKSKRSAEDHGRRQSLRAAERRELMQNLGVHGWTGRLVLLGLRCDVGVFRVTASLSATAPREEFARLRRTPQRRTRQGSRRQR